MTLPGARIENILPFNLNVSRGMTGFTQINKFGNNPDIDTASVPEDIWSGGGTYTFSSVATSYYISSSDATDTQDVNIQTLTEDSDSNWNIEVFSVTLQGQTKTKLAPPSGDMPIRFFRGYNEGATDFAGDVYIYEDDTVTGGVPNTSTKVRGVILDGDNQTEMAIYTIPSGKVGYLVDGYTTLANSKNSFAVVTLNIRLHGGVFRVQGRTAVSNQGNESFIYRYPFPGKIPAKTDIKYTIEEVGANDTSVTGNFTVLLEDIE